MKIMVIAPHPDDETLGCGGTLFRQKQEGDELYWGIITGISEDAGWPQEAVKKRNAEIEAVAKKYGFTEIFNFRLPTTKMDTLPLTDLIEKIKNIKNIYGDGKSAQRALKILKDLKFDDMLYKTEDPLGISV